VNQCQNIAQLLIQIAICLLRNFDINPPVTGMLKEKLTAIC
jgi:hypothetical protein